MTENELLNGTAGAGAPSASKKRRNRKKKGKKKDDDASPTETAAAAAAAANPAPAANGTSGAAPAAAPAEPTLASIRAKQLAKLDDDKLNPHAQLCAKVMRGDDTITLEKVEKALEEMWDLGLSYDEDEAVLKYIKSGGSKPEPVEETAPVANGHAANGHGHGHANGHANGETAAAPAAEEEAAPEATEEEPPQKSMSMADKLDMVADFQSLPDAVFALSEWVNKAAKLTELEDMCAAKKTVAFPTIVRRVIAECDDDQEFDSIVMPEMLRMVGGILEQCGVAITAVAGTRNALKSSLQRARKAAIIAGESTEAAFNSFADRLARFIVSRIAVAVEEAKFSAGDVGAMQRLEREIDALTVKTSNGSSVAHGDDFDDMLAKRNVHKSAAKKCSLVAKIAMNGLSTAGGESSNNSESIRESQMSKSDISLAILGPEGKQRVDLRKAELEALQSQVQDGESQEVQALRASISEYQTEREAIASRIAEMRASIDKLESLDAELSNKIENIEAQITDDIENRTSKAEAFNKRLDGAVSNAKFGKTVHGLVDVLKSYDDALEQAIGQPSTAAVETFAAADNVGEIVSHKMDMFLFRARNYFVSEAECVDFLQARIETTEREIGELKIEIEECQGLGMTTTVGQMEDDLKQKEDLITSDTNKVQEMCDDASTMFDALISRLDRYNSAAQAERLAPIHISALQGIPSCISRLGIPNGERLNSALSGGKNGDIITHSPPKPQRAPVDSFALSTSAAMPSAPSVPVAPIAPPAVVPAMTEQATTMPKFTWAAANAPTAGKQSLLDIQREELRSKDGQ